MNNEDIRDGIYPTAEVIAHLHTGHFEKLLPHTLMIKSAKNDGDSIRGMPSKNSTKKNMF